MNIEASRRRLRECFDEVRDRFGTPAYVFDEDTIRDDYRALRAALDEWYPDSVIHFAVKANYNPGILSVLRDEGAHAEVYARCETTAALAAGFDPSSLLLTGLNRRQQDLERALDQGVEYALVDNETELERLIDAAGATGTKPGLLLRGNPAMDVPTHPDVATATRETKFGLDIESGRALSVARRAVESSAVELVGVQLHVGSQIRGVEPYGVAAREMLDFASTVRDELGVEIEILDLGGGFPVQYDETVPDTSAIVEEIATTVRSVTDRRDLPHPTLFLEPGRRLVGNAGTLLATVGVIKETPYATFAILDAGTNAISSHWPYPIFSLSSEPATESYHVAGPLCYSGDVIAEGVSLPPLESGDILAIDRVGAYSLGSASHTNGEPKPPVVLRRSNGDLDVVRRAETCADVLGMAEVPDDLV